jgi:hypothetical protein
MPNIANNNILVQTKTFHSDLNAYENIDQFYYENKKSSNDSIKPNNKSLVKSKSFFKTNKFTSCIKSKKNNSNYSFSDDDDESEIRKSCISFKNSKLAKTFKSIIFHESSTKAPTNQENEQLNKLFEILNPNILNQLDKIVNSPNICKLLPLLNENNNYSKSNSQIQTVKVADQVKKFNQMNAAQNKNFVHLEPKQPTFDLAKFKQELNAKLELKKKSNDLDLKLPSLVNSSQKFLSSMNLLKKHSSHTQIYSQSTPFLPVQTSDQITAKEISFEISTSERSSIISSLDQSYDYMKIQQNLYDIFQNYDESNISVEIMSYKQLLTNKFKLEQYLFNLDYEFGNNKYLLTNSLYLKLKKRYKLILVLLDNVLCKKCGRKTIV